MAVYGTSPFRAYSSQSFDDECDKHKTPVATYASSPPMALTKSAVSQSTAAAVAHNSQKRMLHVLPVLAFLLLACVLSAAFLLRPEKQGAGTTYKAVVLLKRGDAMQKQPHQQLDAARCRLLHSTGAQHGALDATTKCAEQSSHGSPLTEWSMHSTSKPALDHGSKPAQDGSVGSSGSYTSVHSADAAAGFGPGKRRATHRRALLHHVQAQ